MRKLAIVSCLLLVSSAGSAQAKYTADYPNFVEVTALAGIQFGGSVDLFNGDGEFDWGPAIDAIVGYRVKNDGLVVLGYSRQRTQFKATTYFPNQPRFHEVSVDLGYLQFGGELELPVTERFVPFIGLTVGASHITPRRSGKTSWFFAAAFTGGAKYRITEHFGLRTQMRFLANVISSDSEIFCVSSGGLGCAVSADLNGLFQGDLVAGVYFAF